MGDDITSSRRELFGGLGVVAAASVATAALCQGQQKQPETVPPGTPSTPLVAGYPKPPLPEQRQPWPALQSRMTPRPDSGETSYKGSGRLAGRKALVTGGDSGIGRAAAIAFAREGADVAINYYPTEEPDAREVKQYIEAAGRRAVLLPADIRTSAACETLVADAMRGLGGLDILVNNAAYQQSKESILEISDEQFDRTFKTNIYATFWITKAAVPHLQAGAAIVNTTSINAYEPEEEILDYACTKGAIMIFTKALAKQLASKGIRVNAVAPGPIWTPLQVAGGQLAGHMGEFGANTPFGRPGEPAELAGLYVLLASNEASFSTGQVFGATGGRGGP